MKAYELLSDETKWTQGAFARDQTGDTVSIYSSQASCWCMVGAMWYCIPRGNRGEIYDGVQANLGEDPIVWNDSHTYSDVISKLRELGI